MGNNIEIEDVEWNPERKNRGKNIGKLEKRGSRRGKKTAEKKKNGTINSTF